MILIEKDGKLTVLELEQGGSLRFGFLQFNLGGRRVGDCPALPTDRFSLFDIPMAEVPLADEAKVTDDCRTILDLSNCFVDF